MGAYDAGEQARNLIEVAAAARAAGLDALLTGDSHAGTPPTPPRSRPLPTLARLMSRRPATCRSAWSCSPRSITRCCWPSRSAPSPRSRRPADRDVRRSAAAAATFRRLRHGGEEPRRPARGSPGDHCGAAGRRARHAPRRATITLEGATISPLPRVPVESGSAGRSAASAERAGRWATPGSPARTRRTRTCGQLDLYRETATRAGRPARPVLRRDIYVGESDDEARAVVGAILAEGYRGTGSTSCWSAARETVVEQPAAATAAWASIK